MDLELQGRVFLITGGSDGLGAAAAAALVREGACVAVCARMRTRLEERASLLRRAGGDVLAQCADVTRRHELEQFVAAAVARWGRIDGLVNNAGVSDAARFIAIDDTRWRHDLELKLLAAAAAARLVYDHMKAIGGGSIVNVLSITAKAPGPNSMPTSVTRAAGLALTKALSKEWGAHGIRVNAVLIGMLLSGQWDRMAQARGVSVEQLAEERAAEGHVPLARVGRPEDFGNLIAFLLSPRAGYISGSAINLDGGLSAVT